MPLKSPLENVSDDSNLMSRYQDGDVRAFEELLNRYEKPIYNFILRSVKDPSVAEELTQETFMRVIKGAVGFKTKAKVKTWIYTIARNICIDESRRRKHRKTESLDVSIGSNNDGPTRLEKTANLERDPSDKLQDLEIKKRLNSALERLSDEQRQAFVLRQFQELSFKEIAAIEGVSENTVKSRLRYALQKLKTELEDLW